MPLFRLPLHRFVSSVASASPTRAADARGTGARGAGARGFGGRAPWRFTALVVALLTAVGVGRAWGDGLRPLAQPSAAVDAVSARLTPTPQGGVLLTLDLSQRVDTEVFALSGPDRIVLDLPEVRWRFDPSGIVAAAPPGVRAMGVKRLRAGLFRMGRSRLVLDLDAPMRRGPVRFADRADGSGRSLQLELRPAQAARTGVARRPAALEIETGSIPRRARDDGYAAPAWAQVPRPRPAVTVIALDPGHGGKDPGARYGRRSEKTIVLEMAKLLRDELERHPRLRVVMTREDDRFLELDERVEIARRAQANLFVSLHADALPEHPEISGASFYTLSDRASDALAARIARRENAADGLAEAISANAWARRLLVDYAQRQSIGSAHNLVEGMVQSFRSHRLPLIPSKPHREAGFRVLRNFDQPSMLIELGFLTSIRDQRRFTNPAWRKTAVKALSAAILRWRDERTAPALAGDLLMRADDQPR